jgi:hypothetical protein
MTLSCPFCESPLSTKGDNLYLHFTDKVSTSVNHHIDKHIYHFYSQLLSDNYLVEEEFIAAYNYELTTIVNKNIFRFHKFTYPNLLDPNYTIVGNLNNQNIKDLFYSLIKRVEALKAFE